MSEDDNIVYVGTKDTHAYVLAVMTQATFNTKIHIKARGKSISKAVDISQIIINKSLRDWCIADIKIYTDEREQNENDIQRVSVIDIKLTKVVD